MYKMYEKQLYYDLKTCTENAINMELTARMNKMGAPMTVHFAPSELTQHNKIVKQTIQTEDTSFVAEYDFNDPGIDNKILQFFFIKENPIDLNLMNQYLQVCLTDKGYEVDGLHIEYFNLRQNKLIKHIRPQQRLPIFSISTDTIPLDIIRTVGVRASVAASPKPIIRKMGYQLLLSLVLFLFASYSLVFLFRTIIRQYKLDRMRQDFVNAMVHEFKRPLTNASMMLDLVLMYLTKGDRDKVDANIAGSLTELKKLTAYTTRIQRISNNEKEKIQLEKSTVPLTPFFDRLKTVHYENWDKEVLISTSIETDKPSLFVDTLHFSNVMDNLVENAIKYSGNPVHVDIVIKDHGIGFEISVADNGYGISNIDKKQIFDKFYRATPSHKCKVTGFGLGLTYVKAIVEAHGGSIRVMDAPVKGSIFIINIPD